MSNTSIQNANNMYVGGVSNVFGGSAYESDQIIGNNNNFQNLSMSQVL
jgi:hypothetical protein